jgi:hypothetical protein
MIKVVLVVVKVFLIARIFVSLSVAALVFPKTIDRDLETAQSVRSRCRKPIRRQTVEKEIFLARAESQSTKLYAACTWVSCLARSIRLLIAPMNRRLYVKKLGARLFFFLSRRKRKAPSGCTNSTQTYAAPEFQKERRPDRVSRRSPNSWRGRDASFLVLRFGILILSSHNFDQHRHSTQSSTTTNKVSLSFAL